MEENLENKETLVLQFWNSFLEKEHDFFYGIDDEEMRTKLFYELELKIKEINEHLLFKFSKIKDSEQREFIISANGMKAAFEDVQYLVDKAPTHKNWEFIAFSQRHPSNDLSIELGDITIGYSDMFFRYSYHENEFGLDLSIRNYQGTPGEQNAVFILLDCLLGEYDVTTKIDWINWYKLEESGVKHLSPILELIAIVDSIKK